MPCRRAALVLAVIASLGLAGCNRDADEGRGQPPPGTTGAGTEGVAAINGPGTGLSGGLAPASSASQPTGVAEGSPNRTRRSSVGNR